MRLIFLLSATLGGASIIVQDYSVQCFLLNQGWGLREGRQMWVWVGGICKRFNHLPYLFLIEMSYPRKSWYCIFILTQRRVELHSNEVPRFQFVKNLIERRPNNGCLMNVSNLWWKIPSFPSPCFNLPVPDWTSSLVALLNTKQTYEII